MLCQVTVQRAISNHKAPTNKKLQLWAESTLQFLMQHAELNIRITDVAEMTALNHQYRKKNKPTNVLSFPFEMPAEIDDEIPFLGDIVICADVVNQEAKDQNKTLEAHWAHMIVHGTLHLLGYDHEIEKDAVLMESKEIAILQTLGFNNPYQHNESND